MNKTAIRNFAVWARNKLIADVSYHAGLLGITKNGISKALPQSTKDVEFYDIGTAEPYAIRGEEIQQRKSLVDAIHTKEKDSNYETSYNSLMEEVAYTWFNRLIAVRFMEVNDYLPEHVRVLSSESGKQEPDIVTTPFDAELFFAEGEQQKIIQMKNDNKLDEVFRILFIKQCRELSRILPRLFEETNDYTELLLSLSFIDQEGVVYHLVHDISEDDFNVEKGGQVEIIGWLYQYYNAELKDETFDGLKNNIKLTKEKIPAVTQLFTPDWIVRYMVENSLGRLWEDGHNNAVLRNGWKYYLNEADQEETAKDKITKIKEYYANIDPENIKVLDPCMGSGHILVYAFDVLMQIYESAGYTQRDAAKSILENNLFGLDIDDRAAQLAYFAVMMKARQYNRRILDGETSCNIYAIKESNNFDREALVKLGDDLRPVAERLLASFIDAKEYGSVISVNVTLEDLDALDKRLDDVAEIICTEFDLFIKQARVMVQKYDAVITNPPYMAPTEKQKPFLKKNYIKSKNDLAMVYMERCLEYGNVYSYIAMINFPTWMFLASYEELRAQIIHENTIINMVYPGRGIFGSDFGSTTFVLNKSHIENYTATYLKLFDKIGEVDSVEERETEFLNKKGICCFNQNDYYIIPSNPLAFWISPNMLESFRHENIGSKSVAKAGIVSGNDDYFLRLWFEVNNNDVTYDAVDYEDKTKYLWVPINKGGSYRRHYGNYDYIINIYELWNCPEKVNVSVRRSEPEYYFKEGLTWSATTMGASSYRYSNNKTFATAAPSLFFETEADLYSSLALLNSCLSQPYMDMLNPTVGLKLANVTSMPVKGFEDNSERIVPIEKENIRLTKEDWDSFETSWDFKKHPLI